MRAYRHCIQCTLKRASTRSSYSKGSVERGESSFVCCVCIGTTLIMYLYVGKPIVLCILYDMVVDIMYITLCTI